MEIKIELHPTQLIALATGKAEEFSWTSLERRAILTATETPADYWPILDKVQYLYDEERKSLLEGGLK